MKKFLFTALLLGLTGCGHNMATQSKGWGIELTWNPDALMPSMRLGYWDASYAMVKENASVELESNAGLTADAGNTSKDTEKSGLSSGAAGTVGNKIKLQTKGQTNGYVADVLTSDKAKDNAKLAKYLYGTSDSTTEAPAKAVEPAKTEEAATVAEPETAQPAEAIKAEEATKTE